MVFDTLLFVNMYTKDKATEITKEKSGITAML